jgi:hypothetical protein
VGDLSPSPQGGHLAGLDQLLLGHERVMSLVVTEKLFP